MTVRTGFIATLISLWLCWSTSAEVVPNRWDKLEILHQGARLQIYLISGERLEGPFEGATEDHISTIDDTGQPKELPKSEISKVLALEKSADSDWKRAKWGLLLGGAGGIAAGAATSSRWTNEGGSAGGWIALWGGVGAAAGGGIGFLLDRNSQDRTREWIVVYRAQDNRVPAPSQEEDGKQDYLERERL